MLLHLDANERVGGRAVEDDPDEFPSVWRGGLDQKASLRDAVVRGGLEEHRLMARAAGEEEIHGAGGDRPLSAGGLGFSVGGMLSGVHVSSTGGAVQVESNPVDP
jgi:hypothetical protein